MDTDGDGVLDYAGFIDDDEKRADVLAVLAEHGLKEKEEEEEESL